MILSQWAARWHIPPEALRELLDATGVLSTPRDDSSEAAVVAQVRLEASEKGMRLYRNNVGACYDDKGNFIRYGLANDSEKMNKLIKSGDLIGIRPVLITPAHVGHTIGQFLSRECKSGGWRWSGTDREIAQQNWINHVNALGGDAAFCNGRGSL
jgi:hypothetical protein